MKGRAVALVAVLTLAATLVADAVRPASEREAPAVEVRPAGGVLACPYAVESRGTAYVHLFNAGIGPSSVVVTVAPASGSRATLTYSLEPGAVRTVRVNGRVKGRAGVIVEYTGGEIVATHSVLTPSKGGQAGGAAGTCARAGSPEIVVTHTRTLNAETRLALLNPGGADADVTIALVSDGKRIEPERLKRRIVPARRQRTFRLGDFAFDGGTVHAIISARSGRVVAEAMLVTNGGLSLHGGQVASTERMVLAGRSGSPASVGLVAVGEEDAGLSARLLSTASQQGKAPGIPDELEPDQSVRTGIPSRNKAGAVAYVMTVNAGSPIVAGTTWDEVSGPRHERASMEAAEPAERWAAVLGSAGSTFRSRAIIGNPGDADVRITILSTSSTDVGEDESEHVVPAGGVVSVPTGAGAGTWAILVESPRPIVVGMVADRRGDGFFHGYGVTATSLAEPTSVFVRQDPRAGIPARVEGQ